MFQPSKSNNAPFVFANIATDIATTTSTPPRLNNAALLHSARIVRLWTLLIVGLTISACNSQNDPAIDALNADLTDLTQQTPSDPTERSTVLATAIPLPLKKQITSTQITDLILVTGQSNALGSNTSTDTTLDQPNSRVFAFASGQSWQIADLHQEWDGKWHPGNGSLDDPSRQPFNNFAFHFGKTVAEELPDRVIGIVLITAPGKGIAHWDRNGPYFAHLRDTAIHAINLQGVKSQFDAVLWHQGETDWLINGTADPYVSDDERRQANYYPQKLNSLITELRAQSWIADDAPFICGETASAPVNYWLMQLNSNSDPASACVSARQIPLLLEPDTTPVHFNAAGLREMGKRYAQQYIQMIAQ